MRPALFSKISSEYGSEVTWMTVEVLKDVYDHEIEGELVSIDHEILLCEECIPDIKIRHTDELLGTLFHAGEILRLRVK